MEKAVLVTGGAKGIGRAVALEFAKLGYRVAINTKKSAEALKETLEEVKKHSPYSAGFICDVSDYARAEEMFKAIEKQIGHISVLVNNAGVSHIGLFNAMMPTEWQALMKNNVDSMLNCTHLALPYMIHCHCGSIINISSMWGISGASCEAVYSASKGAVNAFTKALGKELAPSGIFVNAIACGAIDTQMNSFLTDKERAALEEEIPMGRLGRPSEAAALAVYLAEHNTYITGQIISLDGGME